MIRTMCCRFKGKPTDRGQVEKPQAGAPGRVKPLTSEAVLQSPEQEVGNVNDQAPVPLGPTSHPPRKEMPSEGAPTCTRHSSEDCGDTIENITKT